jgi:hypothetical protein
MPRHVHHAATHMDVIARYWHLQLARASSCARPILASPCVAAAAAPMVLSPMAPPQANKGKRAKGPTAEKFRDFMKEEWARRQHVQRRPRLAHTLACPHSRMSYRVQHDRDVQGPACTASGAAGCRRGWGCQCQRLFEQSTMSVRKGFAGHRDRDIALIVLHHDGCGARGFGRTW